MDWGTEDSDVWAITNVVYEMQINSGDWTVYVPTSVTVAGSSYRLRKTVSDSSNNSKTFIGNVQIAVRAPVASPEAISTIPDQVYALGAGSQTLDASIYFTGQMREYALTTAPAGVTINASTGLITSLADRALSGASVVVRSFNANGEAFQTYPITVAQAAVLSGLAYADNQVTVETNLFTGLIYYAFAPNTTPLSGQAIIDDAFGTLDPSNASNVPVNWSVKLSGTYGLQMVQRSPAGVLSNVVLLEVTLIAATYDPASVAALFFDADDLSTLFQTTDTSTQVTAVTQRIGRMTNRGSLGGFWTNSGATDRATYEASGGFNWLRFDGTNDYLLWERTSGDINLSTGYYMIGVLEGVGTTTFRTYSAMSPPEAIDENNPNSWKWRYKSSAGDAFQALAGPANTNGLNIGPTTPNPLGVFVMEEQVVPYNTGTNVWLRGMKPGDSDFVELGTDATTNGINHWPNNATGISRHILGAGFFFAGAIGQSANCRWRSQALVIGPVSTETRTAMRTFMRGKAGL